MFIFHQTTLARLGPLRVTTSHTYAYKKLDEFGKDYNKKVLDSVMQQGEFMEQKAQGCSQVHKNKKLIIPEVGRKLVFDNIDYRHEVHHMTEEHQNVDKHCVTVMTTENRVSGKHLSDVQPVNGVLELENGKCLPSCRDNVKQRCNYIALVGRVITANIEYLKFLQDVTTMHIPHCYMKEMSSKSETVSNIIINT